MSNGGTPSLRSSASGAWRRRGGLGAACSWGRTRRRFEYHIACDKDPQSEAGADREGWRAVHLTLDEPPSRLVDRILRPVAKRPHERIIHVRAKFGSPAEQRRADRRAQHRSQEDSRIGEGCVRPGGAWWSPIYTNTKT